MYVAILALGTNYICRVFEAALQLLECMSAWAALILVDGHGVTLPDCGTNRKPQSDSQGPADAGHEQKPFIINS